MRNVSVLDEDEYGRMMDFMDDYREWEELEDEAVRACLDDPVNHPRHYTQGSIECIEAIEASMDGEAFMGYLKGNAIKYLWRYERKGGVEDLEKARWYVERMVRCEYAE